MGGVWLRLYTRWFTPVTPPTMVTIHLVYITDSFNEMFPIKFCTYVQQLLCTCVTVCECVNCEGESVKGNTLTTQSCHGNYYTFDSLREKVFSGFWSGILVKMFSAIPGGREGGRGGEG